MQLPNGTYIDPSNGLSSVRKCDRRQTNRLVAIDAIASAVERSTNNFYNLIQKKSSKVLKVKGKWY